MASSQRVPSLFASLVRGLVLASLASAAIAATSRGALAERPDAAKPAHAPITTPAVPQARRDTPAVTITVRPLKLSDVKAEAVADWDAPTR